MELRVAELLVRGGVVSREQLQTALDREKKNGSILVQELVHLGFTTEEQLTQFLAKQFSIEKIELNDGEIDDSVFNLVPLGIRQAGQQCNYDCTTDSKSQGNISHRDSLDGVACARPHVCDLLPVTHDAIVGSTVFC